MLNFSTYDFVPVMNHPISERMNVFDFSQGYDPEYVQSYQWGIGKYDEKRFGMYMAPQYENERNIHMGIDIWGKAGESVFSFYDGVVRYKRDNDQEGDYGPTLVLEYALNEKSLYALYGHLSRKSLPHISMGDNVQKGQKIAEIGDKKVNGGWAPHLHFQLSMEDPKEADMPGVVAEEVRKEALQTFPDPRLVLGELY